MIGGFGRFGRIVGTAAYLAYLGAYPVVAATLVWPLARRPVVVA